ncbi:MAG: major capsid protein [Microvirus sp.]|nr:MAG: major capsid protein [Microvirus sp.]
MKSHMTHQFGVTPKANIERSTFDRSHCHKTTFDSGYLIPFYADEVLPGDTFKMRMTIFARLATPVVPIMDNIFLDYHFFYVPNRLVWEHWKNFMGENRGASGSIPGVSATTYLVPQIVVPAGSSYVASSLFDYLGIPKGYSSGASSFAVNALHSRAYNLIYNEWYRSESLIDCIRVDTDDGPDTTHIADYVLRRRCKRHDYFTSCLPWPQKGPGVTIPLGGIAPVQGTGVALGFNDGTYDFGAVGNPSGTSLLSVDRNAFNIAKGTVITPNASPPTANKVLGMKLTGITGLVADLSTATAATINSLRQAFALQRLQERDARGGTRYVEVIKAHFSVTSPDYRQQRPEFLGGGSMSINIHPVTQTAPKASTSTPLGFLAAMGIAAKSGQGFTKSFTEHGVLLGICSVRADLTYQEGLNKMWTRQTKYDYYWPGLSHIGEQSVLEQEIAPYGSAGGSIDATVFGYQERYAEYRYHPSRVSAQFRSSFTTSLDYWHLAQILPSQVALNQAFIEENPPIQRALAVLSPYPEIIMDTFMDLKCTRPMPVYSVPGLIDHF